ncbi:monosaccharide ABC transporter membrane protein (CUT2 family) [Tepidamorphus gemmatus]|jgi:ribose transport system permease protein|uniref:Monosaccharide ABC transporter membrane protein (CUT2 family) n=1 Tax=Tepidamorphus gemmatus TaxID=747076 RepID=A0A4R3ME04_9HYPH|nr:SMP-30/gluconolactonase/LRE family protein [Tepidamorphus gemmatus]TCT11696.1 monosaccharide ABC transporter membrane protein (CUT2 family) [Tepidamorphus gemmatus]
MTLTDRLVRWRYRLVPDHVLGELLSKRWMDNAIPLIILVAVAAVFGSLIPGFYGPQSLSDLARQWGEFALIVLALTIVMAAGGIDLSVGSTFALGNIVALALIGVAGLPVWAVVVLTMACGAAVGLVNGLLVGYLRLRAFLTTLVTLIIVRAVVDMLLLRYAVAIAASFPDSDLWFWFGDGFVAGIPVSVVVAVAVALILHLVLSRTRPGWQVLAVGGSRRSAHNVGIPVRRVICMTYVVSGTLAAGAGVLFASRLGAAGSDIGLGLEIAALTAAVLGGNSLGGGRSSAAKAVIGSLIVMILVNGLVRLGVTSGANSLLLGLVLLIAVAIDVRWLKNRNKVLAKVYVSPTYADLPPAPGTDDGSPYALNDRLRPVEAIGLGEIDGPEDVILDEDDNIYVGNRTGDIVRFLAPDYSRHEVFAHVGGRPLGMALARDGALLVCIGGMGLYRIGQDRTVERLTDETNRSLFSIIDDSRLRLADDLDIAPDGRVFFSEATVRYEMHEWPVDCLESRGNGRIICYDPNSRTTRTVLRNLVFPNGICMTHDGQSFLFAETWACRVSRYWFDGPRKGQVEPIIPDLPGYPDNINRASDGTYWLALVGMRTPAFDLALRMPGFRRRMARRVAPDEWMFPNINTGCVLRFDETGRVIETFWDRKGDNHPMITSMREHKGHLYIGGISNNRIGRLKLEGADPGWTGWQSYWGRA